MRKNKVLIPLDGSAYSRQVLSQLPRFLDASTNQLMLYRVVEEPKPVHIHETGLDLDIYVDQLEQGLQFHMADELRADMEQLRSMGFEVQATLDFGERPAKRIESFVEQNEIDMIAMTTHGRTGLRRIFAGSVAEHVLHHVTVPILLVRPAEETVYIEQEAPVLRNERATPMPFV